VRDRFLSPPAFQRATRRVRSMPGSTYLFLGRCGPPISSVATVVKLSHALFPSASLLSLCAEPKHKKAKVDTSNDDEGELNVRSAVGVGGAAPAPSFSGQKRGRDSRGAPPSPPPRGAAAAVSLLAGAQRQASVSRSVGTQTSSSPAPVGMFPSVSLVPASCR
jgi:hypothetical protein